MPRIAVIVIVLSNLMVLILLGVVAAVIAQAVLPQLLPLHTSGLATGGMAAWCDTRALQPQGSMPELRISNPTELLSAFSFGALYNLMLFAAAWLSDWLGHRGL